MVRLNGYEIHKTVYESTNSLVYQATRQQDQVKVIVKVLKDAHPSPKRIARFRREYDVTRELNLPGTVQAYSLENQRTLWFMTLEDFGGYSLAELKLAGQLEVKQFLKLAIHITDVLGQLHHQHLIHKDLNPANIVYNPDNEQVKIIDFGISTSLAQENSDFRSTNILEGTLAYIAPEQTGRMNRAVNYRADFYSLGVTFYELLTGKLPFQGEDALALIHQHIAVQPTPPHELVEIPLMLSKIIMKLLAKNDEDRYQSAYGLKADLNTCLQQLQNKDMIDDFALDAQGISDKFQIPQTLYGRQLQRETLLLGFERVALGGKELVLVTGQGGIGKSVLVQELYKPITAQRGYFISGKFDQLQRNIPYTALLQAFHGLFQQLLAERDEQIAIWREKIQSALGVNGQVLVELLPEVEDIIGSQPPVPELGAIETQNRFRLVLRNFISLLCQSDHPLVIFLDDLQWADEGSLQLIELLLTNPDTQYLYLIGAYRDNEIGPADPLSLTLAELNKQSVVISSVNLPLLSITDTTQLLADTLHRPFTEIQYLTSIVHDKTAGNPFFLTEFLKTLYEQGDIRFNPEQGLWQWDLAQVHAQQMTNNVVELMANKIQQLPAETQQILKLAACIGNEFDLVNLPVIADHSAAVIAQLLWPAIAAGLILPLNENYKLLELDIEGLASDVQGGYKFAHDRIQQATYSLIPEIDRQQTHYQIATLMRQKSSLIEINEHVFDIVSQFNLALSLVITPDDRLQIAELNLQAGQKAKQATAYQAAVNYFTIARSLLDNSAWKTAYNLMFTLYKEQGEAEFLSGRFQVADELLGSALDNAKSIFDKAAVYIIKLAQLAGQGRYPEIVTLANQALTMLGVEIPSEEDEVAQQQAIASEMARYQEYMQTHKIADLWDLPLMEDATMKVCTHILSLSMDGGFFAKPNFWVLYSTKVVNISINYGLSAFTASGYLQFAYLSVSTRDYITAYEFATLSLRLNQEKIPNRSISSRLYLPSSFIFILRKHISTSLEFQRKAFREGLDTGDFVYAGYGLAASYRYIFPISIYEGLAECQKGIAYFKQANNIPALMISQLSLGFAKCLQGQTLQKGYLDYDDFKESVYVETFEKVAPFFACFAKKHGLQTGYLFGLYHEVLPLVEERVKWISTTGGMDIFLAADYRFFAGLTVAALYSDALLVEQADYLDILNECINELEPLVEQTPINFEHSCHLLKAEKARIEGRSGEAIHFYESGIQSAITHNFPQNEAIGNELAAKFYLAQRITGVGYYYLEQAYYAYERWGAIGKAKDLEENYPQLRERLIQNVPTPHRLTITGTSSSTSTTDLQGLDLSSVIKASQVIAGQIELGKLLETMMQIVIENAGAQRGLLILQQDKRWVVRARLDVNMTQGNLLQATPIEEVGGYSKDPELSVSIVQYVIRTQKSLVLNDATHDERFTRSVYIAKMRPKSVLCMPLLNQGRVSGLLYLENNLSTGAFTPARLTMLDLLSSQMAVSLDNAVLYDDLKQYRDRLQELVEARTRRLGLVASLGEQLNAILDREALLVAIVNGVKDNFNYYHAHIYLLDETKTWLMMSEGTGHAGVEMKARGHKIALNAPASIVAEAARSGRIVNVENVRLDPNWLPNALLPETRSEMAVPIVAEGKVVGVLDVQSEHVAGLDEGDANLLRSLASQVGIALTNARLFGRVQRRALALAQANEEIERKNETLSQTLQELKNTQAQLIESEKMASLGSLVAGVAHEINTPLGIGFTAATTLENKTKDAAELYEQKQLKGSALQAYFNSALTSTRLISNNLQRAGDLVQSFKQVAVDQSNLEQRWFNVTQYITDTVISLNPKLKQTSHELNVMGDEYHKIKSYPGAFSQIITNLVMNSLTHAYDHGDIGHLLFDVQVAKKRLRVEYSDDGHGIPSEYLNKIFDPFFTTGRAKGGTGLGLHIVYNLVTQKLGGTIRCESQVGIGTKFIIELPYEVEAVPDR